MINKKSLLVALLFILSIFILVNYLTLPLLYAESKLIFYIINTVLILIGIGLLLMVSCNTYINFKNIERNKKNKFFIKKVRFIIIFISFYFIINIINIIGVNNGSEDLFKVLFTEKISYIKFLGFNFFSFTSIIFSLIIAYILNNFKDKNKKLEIGIKIALTLFLIVLSYLWVYSSSKEMITSRLDVRSIIKEL